MTTDATEELREFLREHVSSFEKLEVLLFFMKTPSGVWAQADVAAATRLSEEYTESALKSLSGESALLESVSDRDGPAYRLVQSAEIRPLLEKLQRAYDDDRVNLIQIMTSNAIERARSAAALRLANAFRLERSGRK